MQRRLAAILHADVAGYSRLTEADEEGTFHALKASLEWLERTIVDHGGRVVNRAGDAVLAEFGSVTSAVYCGVAVQRELAAHGATGSNRLDFRIGIHLGDVIVDGDNILGDGVNVAARLQALADTGGVCISRTVFNQVRNKIEVGFQCLGERTLKNIAEPVVVYRVLLDPKAVGAAIGPGSLEVPRRRRRWQALAVAIVLAGAAGAAALWLRPWDFSVESTVALKPALPLTDKRFVAVLPFENLSEDRGQDYFSDGITEDIIAALGRFSEIAVIARDSVFQFKGKNPSLQELSSQLGARYLVEGSIRKVGERIRVTVQLSDAVQGIHLWSERYDRQVDDVFAVQDDITQHVAGALAIKIGHLERDRAAAKPPDKLEAYDYLLRGREYLAQAKSSANFEARKYFEKAIVLDPRYAAAVVAQGRTHYYAVTQGWTEFPDDGLAQAELSAGQALRLDATNSDAWQLLGMIYLARGEYELAQEESVQAIELNQSDAAAYFTLGVVLVFSGDLNNAHQALQKSLRIGAMVDRRPFVYLGFVSFLQARYEQAVEAAEKGQSSPGIPEHFCYAVLAAAYAEMDRSDLALQMAAKVLRLWPFFDVDEFVAQFRDASQRAHLADGLHKAGLK